MTERGVSEEHRGKILDEIDAELQTWTNNESHSQNYGDVDLGSLKFHNLFLAFIDIYF